MAEEKQFENQVKKFLQSKGIYPLGIEKQKIVAPMIGYYEKRWGNQFTPSGLPDLSITVNGISLEVELKATRGRPSTLQIKMLKQIIDSGAIGILLYPKDFEKFKDLINQLCLEPKNIDYTIMSCAFGDYYE